MAVGFWRKRRQELREAREIEPLFDAEFYRQTYRVEGMSRLALARDYLVAGWKEGRDPSSTFSTFGYLRLHKDVADSGMNPLLHYVRFGRREARSTRSSSVAGVAAEVGYSAADPMADFFDTEFYLSGFPAGQAPSDPLEHYLSVGHLEGREPAPWFSSRHYLAMNPDVAAANLMPFWHYCVAGHKEGRALPSLGRRIDTDVYAVQAIATRRGPLFEDFDPTIGIGREKRAKVLAYYLPQYHAIDVNDQQWGKGFTEWQQLARGMPRFKGHVQPRIPADMGFYNLAEGDALRRQIQMAKDAGIFGFCFYHYSFNGVRVLDTPMERFLADPTLEFPFCLMWANENWTRTWDGSESEIILRQTYRREDEITFIDDLARHFKDPRYIRVQGRPLFFIYRCDIIPDTANTVSRWRELVRERHGLDPLIFHAQCFGQNDPRRNGLDGAIEFPPHRVLEAVDDVKSSLGLMDPNYAGRVFSYQDVISGAKSYEQPDFPLIRTVFPSWDNEPRRPGRSTIIANSSPRAFSQWLDWAISEAERQPVYGEKLVCVNAWNEWGEGAYLEPDVHFGAAYINALSRTVHQVDWSYASKPNKIILVGHDALKHGAQTLLLNIARVLVGKFGYQVHFLLIEQGHTTTENGSLLPQYRELGHVDCIDPASGRLTKLLKELAGKGFSQALTNTTVTGGFIRPLKQTGFQVVSLIHELYALLADRGLEDCAAEVAELSDCAIFPANTVREKFEAFVGRPVKHPIVRPQGLYKSDMLDVASDRSGVREELGLSADTKIVLGVGYADLRKGIDRFLLSGLSHCSRTSNVAYIWAGVLSPEVDSELQLQIDSAGLSDRVKIIGYQADIPRYFAASDVFYLSSREDPFPSVVLEALATGLSVVGHEGTGGCDDLIKQHGSLIHHDDPLGISSAIQSILDIDQSELADSRRSVVRREFDFEDYVFFLLQRLNPALQSLSVVVPNYNYERYISQRLISIFNQTNPIREIVVLDDASTDSSILKIEDVRKTRKRLVRLDCNSLNTGSPFRQWLKGAQMALGEYLWIAEADDVADPSFVAELLDAMESTKSVLGFTDSKQIDEQNAMIGQSYRDYLNDIEEGAFDHEFSMDSREFLGRFLAVKNVILNVSGVIVKKDVLLEAFSSIGDELYDYKVAGDWRIYGEICLQEGRRVTYLPKPLNIHRRHLSSVTHAQSVSNHLREISSVQQWINCHIPPSERTVLLQEEHVLACKRYLEND